MARWIFQNHLGSKVTPPVDAEELPMILQFAHLGLDILVNKQIT